MYIGAHSSTNFFRPIDNKIRGKFASGGVASYLVSMLEEDLFEALLDTQTFDHEAVGSLRNNENHWHIIYGS